MDETREAIWLGRLKDADARTERIAKDLAQAREVFASTVTALTIAQQEARAAALEERDAALRALADRFEEDANDRVADVKKAKRREEKEDAAFHEGGIDALKYAADALRTLLDGK